MLVENATPAEPKAPAPQAEVAGFLDDIKIVDEGAAPPTALEMDPPIEDVGATTKDADEASKDKDQDKKGKADAEAASGGEKVDPDAEAEAAKTPTLLAGRFATQQQLEVAYGELSKEGRRLRAELDKVQAAHAKELKERDGKIARLTATGKIGPQPREYTDEELNEMTPAQLIRHQQQVQDWKQSQREQENEIKTTQAEEERSAAETEEYIIARSKHMSEDNKEFPGYAQLIPVMEELMDWAPETLRHRKSPDILYLAAVGHVALQKSKVASKATQESEDIAKKRAQVIAAVSGGPGPTKTQTNPAGKTKKPHEMTDQEYNDYAIGRFAGSRSTIF